MGKHQQKEMNYIYNTVEATKIVVKISRITLNNKVEVVAV